MNVFEKTTRRLDAFQQRHKVPAIIVGVIKKFGDDNAGVLVVNLAYAGFVAIFPLLLVLVTILNLVLSGDPGARHAVLNSTLAQFPIIGKQLGGNIHSLQRGSTIGLVIGLVVLCYGTTGLAQAGLFSMSQVWNLPGPERPNFWKRLVRAFGFIGVLAVGLVVTTFLASFGTFGRHNLVLGLAGELVAGLVNAGQFFLAFRVLTPKVVETKSLWPGAVMGGVLWTILQAVGGYLIGHQLRNDSAIYGLFAIVLGLLAWVYLGAKVTIYSAELNTVLARRLWPRTLVQPPLTPADQISMQLQATQNQRRPEEQIEVTFTEPTMSQDQFLKKADEDAPKSDAQQVDRPAPSAPG